MDRERLLTRKSAEDHSKPKNGREHRILSLTISSIAR
jgi:hypothetical protein